MKSVFAMNALIALVALASFAQPAHAWYDATYAIDGQSQIAAAQDAGRGIRYVEVRDVKVVRLMQDDLKGNQHQKWVVQMANGRTMAAVYNISICDRVPLAVGDVISMGGQFIYDRSGGLLHWLHEDPSHERPDGWVEVRGVRYGKVVRNNRDRH